MGIGLQVWDASGNLMLDTSTRLGRVLGYQDVTADGSMTVAGLTTGTGFAIIYANQDANAVSGALLLPTVAFSGTTMSWTYTTGASTNLGATIVYGVY